MPLGQIQLLSKGLGRQATFSFFVPLDKFEPPYPALLQLHGRSDDHTSWFMKSMLPAFLEDFPFVVICPAGDLSSWSNWRLQGPGTNYEEYLMEGLMPEVERVFPVRKGRWAIGGLSMGGYGAIRLGLKYPDRFASIYAHSSGTWRPEMWRERAPHMSDEDMADSDVFAFAERALHHPNRPALTFDCGLDDGLLPGNRDFHRHLDEIGYPHTYLEFPGGHTWPYWNEHVQDALARHAEVMGVDSAPNKA